MKIQSIAAHFFYIFFAATNIALAGTFEALISEMQSWEMRELTEERGQCSLRFVGAIREGDFVAAIEDGTIGGRYHRICLDSEGGSLIEVHNFVREMQSRGFEFSTRVLEGDVCLSACATLFMFGHSTAGMNYNQIVPSRILDPGATLGFHTPFIPPDNNEVVSGSDYFDGGVAIANLLFEYSYNHTFDNEPLLPPEILSIMFNTPSDQLYLIDTIGDAAILNIQTAPPTRPNGVGAIIIPNRIDLLGEAVYRTCITSFAVRDRAILSSAGYSFSEVVAEVAQQSDHSAGPSVLIEFNGGNAIVGVAGPFYLIYGYSSQHFCRVFLDVELVGDEVGVTSAYAEIIPSHQEATEVIQLDRYPRGVNTVSLFPIAGLVPITTPIALEYRVSPIRMYPGLNIINVTERGRSSFECVYRTPDVHVRNVNEYVNIRSQPNLRAPIVARAQLGERLSLLDPEQWWFLDTPRGQECSRLCEQAPSNNSLQPQLRQCIEDAEIWHQVRNDRGQVGFVSIYFLAGAQ
jgi:hypothetical protein